MSAYARACPRPRLASCKNPTCADNKVTERGRGKFLERNSNNEISNIFPPRSEFIIVFFCIKNLIDLTSPGFSFNGGSSPLSFWWAARGFPNFQRKYFLYRSPQLALAGSRCNFYCSSPYKTIISWVMSTILPSFQVPRLDLSSSITVTMSPFSMCGELLAVPFPLSQWCSRSSTTYSCFHRFQK